MDKPRLSPQVFEMPAAEIRYGYRSAVYFNRAKRIAEKVGGEVLMQLFQKQDAVLCGMDEALALIQVGTGRWHDQAKADRLFGEYLELKLKSRGAGRGDRYDALVRLMDIESDLDELWQSEKLDVDALHDGDAITPWETVMHINGMYSAFAHLESVYLGVLARRTLVASNTRRVCEAANGKQVLFFADRFDHWANQGGDGYAAYMGGATGVASDAMAAWWGDKGVGTMPHALIALFNGDSVAASKAFCEEYPETNLIALVDFNNDCVTDALMNAETFGDQLWGVRLDTSENMVDSSVLQDAGGRFPVGSFKPTGVNPRLVENVRYALDLEGHEHVKIVVSGGFNPEKIAEFEALDLPTDAYAVGSSLLRGCYDFTADVVRPAVKKGRQYRENKKMERVKWN